MRQEPVEGKTFTEQGAPGASGKTKIGKRKIPFALSLLRNGIGRGPKGGGLYGLAHQIRAHVPITRIRGSAVLGGKGGDLGLLMGQVE